MDKTDIIENLLSKPYWLIDVLPKQVPAGSAGQYFKAERYSLSWLEESAAYHSPLSILIGSDEALVTFSGDDHYMTIYNPDEELLELVRQCAQAEGLFVWGPKNTEP